VISASCWWTDHEVVRLGLKALLSRHPRFEVVGEAGTADEALAKA
jgi:DNA-binding NarL/FixJ family response regulator